MRFNASFSRDKDKIIFFFLFMFLSISCFYIGFHNADNCHGLSIINRDLKSYKVEYVENNAFIKNMDVDQCYMTGFTMMHISFIIMALLFIWFFVEWIQNNNIYI